MPPRNRRTFLKTSAAASLAAISLDAAPKREIKKALKWHMILDPKAKTTLDKFRLIADCGFDGVEFRGPIDIPLRDVEKAMAKTGMAVPGMVAGANGRKFSSADPDVAADGVKQYTRALEQVAALGGTTVLMYPGTVNAKNPYDQVYRRIIANTRKVIPTAEKTGVKVAFENVWNNFLLSPLEAARFVDDFKTPAVSWYFDVGNVVNTGWPEQWIRILGKRISKLDIKEYSRKKRDAEGPRAGFRVPLGEGDCDWPEVMKALNDIGYTRGWGSAEVPGGDRIRLTDISQRMDKIFAS